MHLRELSAFLAVTGVLMTLGLGQSSVNATKRYAYGANTGWINFRPSSPDGVVVTETFLSGFAYGANFGWINLGNGAPANGHTYANQSSADFGVNHDGMGNLSGYAYAANIGWINFGSAASSDSNRPQINLLDGQFSGYAYSANTGWINLGGDNLRTDTLVCIDTDADGMADSWEMAQFSDLVTAGLTTDQDQDGVLDRDEYLSATGPNDPASLPGILAISPNEEKTRSEVTFTSSPSRLYLIELSTNLVDWGDSGLGIFAVSDTTTTRSVVHPAGGRRFFRATALKPLQP
jgi:hypothetical protein